MLQLEWKTGTLSGEPEAGFVLSAIRGYGLLGA